MRALVVVLFDPERGKPHEACLVAAVELDTLGVPVSQFEPLTLPPGHHDRAAGDDEGARGEGADPEARLPARVSEEEARGQAVSDDVVEMGNPKNAIYLGPQYALRAGQTSLAHECRQWTVDERPGGRTRVTEGTAVFESAEEALRFFREGSPLLDLVPRQSMDKTLCVAAILVHWKDPRTVGYRVVERIS